ncbi:MAG: hypothetical protein R3B70_45825 [Polyangiaceae bacterium]
MHGHLTLSANVDANGKGFAGGSQNGGKGMGIASNVATTGPPPW